MHHALDDCVFSGLDSFGLVPRRCRAMVRSSTSLHLIAQGMKRSISLRVLGPYANHASRCSCLLECDAVIVEPVQELDRHSDGLL